ncbi:uncharacterized protein LOC124120131 isoform X2 [Haliotis rufescens]|uniref:uncharacterized protein LOC124120131 isoform X2 n=1 Tax=Haliotis rufescens TaxID=6454 RepID=UPI001EB09741|nr:uncharacterized protein LOC124120131 isoform X2 [Haliotis rufescens]
MMQQNMAFEAPIPSVSGRSTKITDIGTMFKEWAWTTYLKTPRQKVWSRKLKIEEVDIQLKWDKVRITSLRPEYTEMGTNGHRVHVLYDSKYQNNTDEDQEQTFRAEKETISTATTKLTKGFSREINVGIELTLPPNLPQPSKAEASFGHRLYVDNEEENTIENKVKWSVDTKITSRRNLVTVAELAIEETSSKYEFSMDVKLKGTILAVIQDARGQRRHVMTVQGDVATVLGDMKDKDRFGKLFTVHINNSRTVTWPVSGSLHLKYGVSQTVKIFQRTYL